MINVSIDKPLIPDGAGFKHKSTSWQIATSKDFVNDILVESLDDEDNLLEYHVLNKLEDDQVVFARVKIKFDNDTETEWSRPITLSEHQKGFKLSNTIVITPELFMDDSVLDVSDDKELIVRTSEIGLYAGVGKHMSTSWFLETIYGVKIWERLNDKDNLTKISIPKESLVNNKFYVVKAQHTTDTNTNSNYGKITFSTGIEKLERIK